MISAQKIPKVQALGIFVYTVKKYKYKCNEGSAKPFRQRFGGAKFSLMLRDLISNLCDGHIA